MLILISLLPLAVSIGLWQFFWGGRRRDWISVACALDGRELAGRLAPHHELAVVKRSALWSGKSTRLAFTSEQLNARDAASLGMVAQEAGLRLVMDGRPDLAKRRRAALRFGAVAPGFVMMIVALGALVGRVHPIWAILGVLMAIGLAAILNLLTLAIELQGAGRARKMIAENRIFPRLSEEEAVMAATAGAAWRKVVPAGMAWCLPRR